ncbi:MAG: hypothetical protein KKG76_04145 [Euryarchaeota archaeon]|nr:hypothetical protein [Euryarchaeota archaeon]
MPFVHPPPIAFSPDPPARPGAIDSRWLGKRNKVMGVLDVKGCDPALIEDPVHFGEEYIT